MIETKRAAMRIPTTVTHDVTTPSQESMDYSEPNSPAASAHSNSSIGYTNLGMYQTSHWCLTLS